MPYYTYILRCDDGYLYTGITSSLNKRLLQHQIGLSRLTKSRGGIRVVYHKMFVSRKDAAKREKEIKGWRREKKDHLIEEFTLRKL